MPRKVSFRVASCSGWEDEYHPNCLEVHNPFVKGWRSPRWCLYPQELLVKLASPYRIRKLQFLSHQYLIPSKIELCVGDTLSLSPSSLAPQNTQFRSLGYISLSDNEQTGFRSRELKSVSLDVTTQLIKLIFYHNHINQLNVFNQVSLVALNVIADIPNEETEETSRETIGVTQGPISTAHGTMPAIHTDPILLGAINKPTNISPLDDLAFDVAQDPETAQVIRRLEALKLSAVREENFELARKIKEVTSELQKFGEILCQYEVEKKLAIEREDYETAKDKKLQGEHLRAQIYEHWGVLKLLGGVGLSTGAGSIDYQNTARDHSRAKNPAIMKGGMTTSVEIPSVTLVPSSSQVPLPRSTSQVPVPRITGQVPMPRSTSQVPMSVSTSQERQLPISRTNPLEDRVDTMPLSEGDNVLSKPEPMSDKQLNECSFAVETFGTAALEHICSKQYLLREKGLNMVLQMLPTLELPSRKEVSTSIKATCQVLSRGLNDQVLPTFTLAVELLKYLLGPYAQKHRFLKSDYSFIVGKVTPVLLTRAGDMAPRIRVLATDTLLYIAHHEEVKNQFLLGPLLAQPIKKQSSGRLVVARLEVLERFLQDFGMDGGGLTLVGVMEVINVCLVHVNKTARDIAVRITLDLYKQYGGELKGMLPPGAEDINNKITVWKALFDGFEKMDGTTGDSDRKAAAHTMEVSKQYEIKKLKSQLKVLRELAAKAPTGEASLRVGEEETLLHEEQPAAPLGERLTDDASKLDMTCVFCGEKRTDFKDNNLESHYLTDCPMLAQCTHCSQIVEIPELKTHWLTGCKVGEGFKECTSCRIAVPAAKFSDHVQANSCSGAADTNSNVCPLCHQLVPPGDSGWKEHLLSSSCPMNTRTKRGRTSPSEAPPPHHKVPVITKRRQTKKK